MRSIKVFACIAIFTLLCFPAWSQFRPCIHIDFNDKGCLMQFYADTVSNPNNIWQIGKPQKQVLDSAYIGRNALITDTLNFYPSNDTSYYIGYHYAEYFALSQWAFLDGQYNVNSDSMADYGTIEISYDTAKTWINLIDSTIYSDKIYWESEVPILSGNSKGWKSFRVFLGELSREFNILEDDLVYFRFGFIADSNSDTLDGLMYDYLWLEDNGLGLEDSHSGKLSSKSYPNPAKNSILIEFENDTQNQIELFIYDSMGQQMKYVQTKNNSSLKVDLTKYASGNYFYKLIDLSSGRIGRGHFMVSR